MHYIIFNLMTYANIFSDTILSLYLSFKSKNNSTLLFVTNYVGLMQMLSTSAAKIFIDTNIPEIKKNHERSLLMLFSVITLKLYIPH
jgi:hypothetical protein